MLIHPNWHVMLVHFPLALLTVGVLIELLAFLWPASRVRIAGRWMILLGALACVPAVTTGIYAYNDAVRLAGGVGEDVPWRNAVTSNHWTSQQWELINDHLVLAIIASGIFLATVVKWIAFPDRWRQKFRYLFLVALLAGLGVVTAAAWHSGEAVFRYGTAVGMHGQEPSFTDLKETEAKIEYLLPPGQLHLLLAGCAAAVALAALGLSIRRWFELGPAAPAEMPVGSEPAAPEPTPAPPEASLSLLATSPVFPARFWLIAAVLGLGTAVAGLWMAEVLKINLLPAQLKDDLAHGFRRRFVHVVFGGCIFVLLLTLALLTRFAPRNRIMISIAGGLLLLAVAVQVWVGVLLLYDSEVGPLMSFRPPAG